MADGDKLRLVTDDSYTDEEINHAMKELWHMRVEPGDLPVSLRVAIAERDPSMMTQEMINLPEPPGPITGVRDAVSRIFKLLRGKE